MSVIFNALKKLKNQSKTDEQKKNASIKERRNVYTLPQIILSPFILLPVTVVVIGGFFGYYYGSIYISEYLSAKKVSAAKEITIEAPLFTETNPLVENEDALTDEDEDLEEPEDIPPPPDMMPPDIAEVDTTMDIEVDNFKPSPTDQPEISKPKTYEYIKPTSSKPATNFSQNHAQKRMPSRMDTENQRIVAREATVTSSGPITRGQEGTPQITDGGKSAVQTVSGQPAGNGAVSSAGNAESQPPTPNIQNPDSVLIANGETSYEPMINTNLSMREDGTYPPGLTYVPELPQEYNYGAEFTSNVLRDGNMGTVEKTTAATLYDSIHRVNIQKSTTITKIVEKIENKIKENKIEELPELLDRLTGLKGEENLYVLKLKAFSLINDKNFKAAEALLQKILEKNKGDLEAGINMAILEIKTNRTNEARQRLLKLQKLYPENTFLPDMANKLK